jgi:tetratricopeptide (TPR) repeat protein
MKKLFYLLITVLFLLIACRHKGKEYSNNVILKPHLMTSFSYMQSPSQDDNSPSIKYYNNGCLKMMKPTQDYVGAIEDFNKAIEYNSKFVQAYLNRGYSKANLQDYMGAIADYNTTIEIKDNESIYRNDSNDDIYNNRGAAKYNLQDYRGAVEDFNKAIEFKNYKAIHRLNKVNAMYMLKEFNGVITDCNFIIENSQFTQFDKNDAYYWRGLAKIELGYKESGCLDLSKAGELGYSEAYEAIKKYCK